MKNKQKYFINKLLISNKINNLKQKLIKLNIVHNINGKYELELIIEILIYLLDNIIIKKNKKIYRIINTILNNFGKTKDNIN